MTPPRYWLSPVGTNDDFGVPITNTIIDGRTIHGSWALMTPASFAADGTGRLGIGYGQKYVKQADGKWLKVEG